MKQCPRCEGTGKVVQGEEMKALRLQERLEAKTVAERMGISQSFLCDLENNRRDWTKARELAYRKALIH